MHAVLIIDEERLTHEHAMLRRLCVGLIDHGIRLTRIVPETIASEPAAASEEKIALASRIRVPMKVLPWWRRSRAERVAAAMERDLPDVLYAVGRGSWTLALDLSEVIAGGEGRPLAINVWSPKLIDRVPLLASWGHGRFGFRGRSGIQHIAAYIAASAPIAEALSDRCDPGLISLVPMGAPIPKKPRAIFQRHPNSIGIAVLGSCEDIRAYEAMLGGLAAIVRRFPGVHIAVELRGPRAHEVWRIAQRFDLLGSISAIDDAAQHRSLLIQCDVMLLPERRGELNSLFLEAMAGGMPVIARDDPYLDVIVEGETGAVVKRDESDEWAERIARLLDEPERARQLGLEGRRRVKETHGSAEQVRRLATTLEWIGGRGAYQFEGARV